MGKEQLFLLIVVFTPLLWGLVAYALWRFWLRKSISGRLLSAEAALLGTDKAMAAANARIDKIEENVRRGFSEQAEALSKLATSISEIGQRLTADLAAIRDAQDGAAKKLAGLVKTAGENVKDELTAFKTAREESEKVLAETIVAIQKEFEVFTKEQRKVSSSVVAKAEIAQSAIELHVAELASALGIVAERLRNGDAASRVKGLEFEKTATRVDYEFMDDGKVRATTSVGGVRRYVVTHASYGAVLDGKIYDEKGKKVVKAYSYDNVG